MAYVMEPDATAWTAADLVRRFGALPLSRIRWNPPPGTATEQDVVDIEVHEDRLCELVDGTLVEKTVSSYESYLASYLASLLNAFVRGNNLGIILGADGMLRLAPGQVRIPDVSFISWDRLPGRRISRQPIWGLAPDLAVEVISKGNTPEEMNRKLDDYFAAGVRQVWYVYPEPRQVRVYTSREQSALYDEPQTLEGGDVLPGFTLALKDFFAEPGQA